MAGRRHRPRQAGDTVSDVHAFTLGFAVAFGVAAFLLWLAYLARLERLQ